jgi:hypothetical protein
MSQDQLVKWVKTKGTKKRYIQIYGMGEEVFQSVCDILYLVLSTSRKGISMPLFRSGNTTDLPTLHEVAAI